jgi:hypothetical protein
MSKLVVVCRKVGPFWIFLAVYLLFRWFALGTAIGGYDDRLSGDWNWFVHAYPTSAKAIFFPVNLVLTKTSNSLCRLWVVLSSATAVLLVVRCAMDSSQRKTIIFLLAFLLSTFIPVYKVLCITSDLQQGRYAYIMLVPICALMAFAFTGPRLIADARGRLVQTVLSCACAAAFVACCACLAWKNNLAWYVAGLESNHLRAAFSKLPVGTHEKLAVIGVVDNIAGGVVWRNASSGLVGAKQSKLIFAGDGAGFECMQRLKQALVSQHAPVKIVRWDTFSRALIEVKQPLDCRPSL